MSSSSSSPNNKGTIRFIGAIVTQDDHSFGDNNDNNDDDDMSAPNEPEKKRLRFSDPDLKVIVQSKSDDDDDKVVKKEYQLYAPVLARQSKFVDTTLSVNMKEQETRQIIFHDVTPDLFELALKFVDSPLAVRSMTPKNALQVICFYDKYEFTGGMQLCDEILKEFVTRHLERTKEPINVDLLVDAIVAAHQYNLEETLPVGIHFLRKRFHTKGQFGATMFTVVHMTKLQPLLATKKVRLPIKMSSPELESPLFPRFFVETMSHRFTKSLTKAVQISGTKTPADGHYRWKGSRLAHENAFTVSRGPRNGTRARCYIVPSAEYDFDWTIVSQPCTPDNDDDDPQQRPEVLWHSPHSRNLEFPPANMWINVAWSRQFRKEPPLIQYVSSSSSERNKKDDKKSASFRVSM